jgi:hypothetical protein
LGVLAQEVRVGVGEDGGGLDDLDDAGVSPDRRVCPGGEMFLARTRWPTAKAGAASMVRSEPGADRQTAIAAVGGPASGRADSGTATETETEGFSTCSPRRSRARASISPGARMAPSVSISSAALSQRPK